MGSIVVFVVGIVALVVAGSLIWRYRDTRRPVPLVLAPDSSVGSRVALVAQRSSGMLTAAAVAGILVPGIAGRLMMRLLAATSPASAQGRLTDADEIVGKVTFDGTVGLVLFIGFSSCFLGLGGFMLLRPWLPQRSVAAGLVVAGIGGGLFARPVGFINPNNKDFTILSPAWLAVSAALVVVGVFGVLVAVLVDRWASRWPPIDRSAKGVLAAVPGLAIYAVGVLAVLPAVVMTSVMAFTVFVKPRWHISDVEKTAHAGRKVVATMGVVGAAWVLVSSVQILQL